MNWETGEEDGAGWGGLAPGRDSEDESYERRIASVITIRCMAHRDAPQINKAENNTGECGECVRQQCWRDMLGLIGAALNDTPISTDGKEALCALEATLCHDGIGTFGVADKLEAVHAEAASQSVYEKLRIDDIILRDMWNNLRNLRRQRDHFAEIAQFREHEAFEQHVLLSDIADAANALIAALPDGEYKGLGELRGALRRYSHSPSAPSPEGQRDPNTKGKHGKPARGGDHQ